MRSRRVKDQGFSYKYLLLHPAVWFLLATGTLVYLGIYSWNRHRATFLDSDRYSLMPEAIEVSESPQWIKPSLNRSIMQFVANDRSLLDTQLLQDFNEHLSKAPWIRNIDRIEKSVDGLQLYLRFREPIAILDPIATADNRTPLKKAVDGEGVIFDQTLLEPVQYARLKNQLILINLPGLNVANSIPWHPARDSRIQPAAQLAEFLAESKTRLELYRIVSFQSERRAGDNPQFEIWTSNGTSIIWGSAPGFENQNESIAHDKLMAIEEYVSKYGKLKNFDNRGTHAIDVTSGEAVVLKYERTAQKSNWLNAFK